MREPDLEPTPRSRLERAYDAFGSLPLVVLAGVLFVPVQSVLGWWPTLVIVITTGVVFITAVQLTVIAPCEKSEQLVTRNEAFSNVPTESPDRDF
ncbi:MAG: hypothetical protein NTU93_15920 [Arthrobacter sp.]|nr:hypothetical protein [Arthrobacter sp.]